MARVGAVHVDLDGAREIYEAHGWGWSHADDPVFETGMANALAWLERHGLRATLFAVSNRLDDARGREWLQEAVRRGHEIASHTATHAALQRLDRARKRDELKRSREALEDGLGTPVAGFRAPGYSIDREGLELLDETGYVWDSSAFPLPAVAARLGVRVARLRAPGRPLDGRDLIELPLPDYRPGPVPFSPSYALTMGLWYFRQGLRLTRRRGAPFVLLFHLIDFAEPLPPERLRGWKSRVFTLSHRSAPAKLRGCDAMIEAARRHFHFVATRELLEPLRSHA